MSCRTAAPRRSNAASSPFVDEAKVHLRSGDGGAGVVAFLREAHRPKGGPDGGDGGAGGDVILRADASVTSLLRYRRNPHHRAASGAHGSGDRRHGRRGADLVVPVPVGTTVRDDSGTVLADLVAPGDSFAALVGGRGGRGNAHFVSARRRAPTFAEQGEYGHAAWFLLELRLIADVALVGFPNAGKSTFLSRVSAAKPKIADYPFTTLQPHLGVATVDDRELVVADVPGLIEGAAEGRGLGHRFLRHTERAHVLLVLLDPVNPERTPGEQYATLVAELGRYSPELASRPRVVVVTKADLRVDLAETREWAAARGIDTHEISAVTGAGLAPLLRACAAFVDAHKQASPAAEGYVLHRPVREELTVRRHDDGWVVVGGAVERLVRMADLTNPDAVRYIRERLGHFGVEDALRRAGVEVGDEVTIGPLRFEFEEDEDDRTDVQP